MLPSTAQCDEIAPLLGPFQDGELLPHLMKEVARHLAGCPGCEATLADFATLGGLMRESAPEPVLDGFAAAVHARIKALRPPLRARLGGWLEAQRGRFGNGVSLGFAMAAAAILTVVITTPLARNMLGAGNHVTRVAMRDARALKRGATKSFGALASAASGEPSTIISKLETSNPDVAVWSEPSQDTTVIWLPDQQH